MPVAITNTVVAKARSDVRAGDQRYEISDSKTRGLVLRVNPAGGTWQLRFAVKGKDKRLPLGSIDLLTLADARELVDEGRALVRSGVGIPDERWLQRKLVTKGKVEKPEVGHQDSLHLVRWTFANAREKYLERIRETRSKGTFDDYRQKLQSIDLRPLDSRPVASISRIEMAQLIAKVHTSGRESTAESLVRIVGAFWTWLGEDTQTGSSGVQPSTMKGLKAPERKRRATKRIVEDPTLEDLGRIIAIARSGALNPAIACAIQLTVFTVQRRRAVVSAHELDFKPIGDGSEGLWFVHADDRKRSDGQAHVIPLPAPAWDCVQRAIKLKKSKSPFLFPGFRPRKKGDDVGHLNVSALTHNMGYMPGVDSSPHHVRAVFGTYGEAVLGLLRSETKTILDHAEGGQRTDVTGRHYALHDGTHAKWPIMRKWVEAVEADAAKAAAELEPVEELKAAIAAARYQQEFAQAAE